MFYLFIYLFVYFCIKPVVVDEVQVNSIHTSLRDHTSTPQLLLTDVTTLLHNKNLV
jgi:hypothetical protein